MSSGINSQPRFHGLVSTRPLERQRDPGNEIAINGLSYLEISHYM